MSHHLNSRHIQNYSDASSLEPHWGYADRVIPCTNDAKTCEYLDVVYHSHDLGMLYCGIIWATIVGILIIWCICTFAKQPSQPTEQLIEHNHHDENGTTITHHVGRWERVRSTLATYRRLFFLPEFGRRVFGRTTRLQVLVLVVLMGYLAIFSFVGILYRIWITPVKRLPGVYNTRTSLGPWADRVGTLAFALTPLSILLSSRESILSIITGLPYQSFNFLHRWLGYIIVIQSTLHTIGWCVIEMRLYQPQPNVGREWIVQLYMIWGVVAMLLLFALFVLSMPWMIKRTGYEFFRKSHYVLAMLYIGACWGHWSQLQCYLIPALLVWFIDRGVRLARTALLHYRYVDGGSKMEFRCIDAGVTLFQDPINGDVVRLDFQHCHDPWAVGQHFYLTFPKSSVWQSHPFTPFSAPVIKDGVVKHSYLFRAKAGETAKIAQIAKVARRHSTDKEIAASNTPVILSGPYGVSEENDLTCTTNILCIAGGTGITYVLPVLLSQIASNRVPSNRKVQLVWAIRQHDDLNWIRPELERLQSSMKNTNLQMEVFLTREDPEVAAKSHRQRNSAAATDVEKSVLSTTSSLTKGSAFVTTAATENCCSENDKVGTFSLTDTPISRSQRELNPTTMAYGRPILRSILNSFVASTVLGSTTVFASGPGEMISELRLIVADLNDGSKVWKGDMRHCIDLKCDDRLEW